MKVVYANDVDEGGVFSTIKYVLLDDKYAAFYYDFALGNIPIQWQKEMIETGNFCKMNIWGESCRLINDLDPNYANIELLPI